MKRFLLSCHDFTATNQQKMRKNRDREKTPLELRVSFCNWHSLLNTHENISLRFCAKAKLSRWLEKHTLETGQNYMAWFIASNLLEWCVLFFFVSLTFIRSFWLIQFNCKQKNVKTIAIAYRGFSSASFFFVSSPSVGILRSFSQSDDS